MATPSAKYCLLESNGGQSKYFICGRHEYCCTFGCCVHLAFQFYQLWYYWLILIFMFMVCSGGSWWFRFCRHNDSTGSIRSQIPGSDTGSYYGTNHHLLQHSTPIRYGNTFNNIRHSGITTANDYDRRVTLVRNNAGHSYYYRNCRNSNYYDTVRCHNGGTGDRTLRRYQQQQQQQPHYHQTNFLPRPELCPYYQLYGPPPSYASVIQLSSDNGTTLCSLAEPITSIAPLTNDEQSSQSSVVSSTIITPGSSSLATSPRIIQPIVTVNLSNALSTSIEVHPICSASGNLSLGDSLQSQPASGISSANHVEVVQQQLQHPIQNHVVLENSTEEASNNLNISKTSMEPNIEEETQQSDSSDDQNHINKVSSTTTTTTTSSPFPFQTNFLMRNEKNNSIPSVCSSISTLTAVPQYCNNEPQLQQESLLSHHQLPAPNLTILNDFDNTQCTCSIGSSAITISPSTTTTTNKSINEFNKTKCLKSSTFNRKYYKKNSNSNNSNNYCSSNNNSSSCNNSNNTINSISRGTNCNSTVNAGEFQNTPNSLSSSIDRSVIDNLISNSNEMTIPTTVTEASSATVATTPSSVSVAITKTPSKKN